MIQFSTNGIDRWNVVHIIFFYLFIDKDTIQRYIYVITLLHRFLITKHNMHVSDRSWMWDMYLYHLAKKYTAKYWNQSYKKMFSTLFSKSVVQLCECDSPRCSLRIDHLGYTRFFLSVVCNKQNVEFIMGVPNACTKSAQLQCHTEQATFSPLAFDRSKYLGILCWLTIIVNKDVASLCGWQ